MKSKCLLLLKAQLANEWGGKSKSKGRTVTRTVIWIVAAVMIVYAFFMAYGLGSIGMASVVPSYAVAITSLVMLFFTAFKANGVLFAYKEYDFMMALPVKTSTVIASRFLAMYVMNAILTAAVMIPMGIGYVVWAAPGFLFYPQWLLGILAIPLIPTTLAAMLGALIILLSSRFKYANALVIVLSLALTIGAIGLSAGLGSMQPEEVDITQLQSLSAMLLEKIHLIYPPAILFYDGVVRGQLLSMLAFLAGSVLWYYLFIKAISVVYKKLNTALMTFHARDNYKLTELKASSQLSALYRKERKRFFSSTMYCLNMGMGSVLAMVASTACLFVGKDILTQLFSSGQVWDTVQRVLPFGIGALISMSCTTCVSLSLEGKNLWIVRSLPVRDETIFKSKILWNLTIQIPPALLAGILLNIRLPLSSLTRVMIFLTPVAYALFSSVWGMFINVKMPDYGYVSETALVKQSMPAMAGMFGGMISGIIPLAALIPLRGVPAEAVTVGLTLALAAAAFFLWQYVKKQKVPVG